MRIALFGGSFDPPHLGHLRIAQAAADRLQLDRVLLAPVAVQPLKRGQQPPPASFADRMAMLRLLLQAAGDRRLEVSSLDEPRPDGQPNYTYETLVRLRASLAQEPGAAKAAYEPAEVFLLAGADSLLTLPQWHRALDLLLTTKLLVATRPGFPLEALSEPLLGLLTQGAGLHGSASNSIAPTGRLAHAEPIGEGVERLVLPFEPTPGREAQTATLYLLTGLHEDISATAVRAALAGDEDERGRAPAALSREVAAYIRAHGLYRSPDAHDRIRQVRLDGND